MDKILLEKLNMIENKALILVFDCFGVIFEDKFKEFLNENKKTLQEFVKRKDAPLKAKQLGYPEYYYYLGQEIDSNHITDNEFYRIFETASGVSGKEIKKMFNDADCTNNDLLRVIMTLKRKGYKTALIANADKKFLQKFLRTNIQHITDQNSSNKLIGNLFDFVRTSSDIGDDKCSDKMITEISRHFNVSNKQLILIDDSLKNIQYFKKQGLHAIHYQNSIENFLNDFLSSLVNINSKQESK